MGEYRTGRSFSWEYRTPLDTEKDAERARNTVVSFDGPCNFCRRAHDEIHKPSCVRYDPIPDVLIRAASTEKLTGNGLIW